jgi:hypothetical protein
MRYRGFLIGAFEREPGKWHVRVGRAHGRNLKSADDRTLQDLIIGTEHSSAVVALTVAMEAVDGGFFARRLSIASALAFLMFIAPHEASAKGGVIHLFSAVSRAEAGTTVTPSRPEPTSELSSCGGRRYRDPNTHRCRGPADW